SPIEAWRAVFFGESSDDPAIAGDQADPDGDGLVNLVEYALGLDPCSANPGSVLQLDPDRIGLEFPTDPGAHDVSIVPEWSHDLITWHDSGWVIESRDSDRESRRLHATLPTEVTPIFIRLRVVKK